jgi:hypothetical protein
MKTERVIFVKYKKKINRVGWRKARLNFKDNNNKNNNDIDVGDGDDS